MSVFFADDESILILDDHTNDGSKDEKSMVNEYESNASIGKGSRKEMKCHCLKEDIDLPLRCKMYQSFGYHVLIRILSSKHLLGTFQACEEEDEMIVKVDLMLGNDEMDSIQIDMTQLTRPCSSKYIHSSFLLHFGSH